MIWFLFMLVFGVVYAGHWHVHGFDLVELIALIVAEVFFITCAIGEYLKRIR